MSIGEKFATKNEVEVLRRKLQLALNGATIVQIEAEEIGVTNFTDLADVPSSYAAAGNFAVRVNSTVDALEFAELKGTTNQVIITPHAADHVFSLPQDIHTAATPTFAGMYLESDTIAPFLKLTNESDTERDPIIQFAVGATPVTRWTHGLDDSLSDDWLLCAGDILTDTVEGDTSQLDITYDGYLVIADWHNDRIKKHLSVDGTYQAKIGTVGTGDNNFQNPEGICSDGTYVYVTDYYNHRIKKHLLSDLSFVAAFGTEGSGNNQFQNPRGICTDGTYLYIADTGNGRIKKHLCSDLSYVTKSTVSASSPRNICVNGTYVYSAPASPGATYRLYKYLCSDLSLILRVIPTGNDGHIDNANIVGLCTTGGYLYIANSHVYLDVPFYKYLCWDLTYSSEFGAFGTGDGQIDNFNGIATDGTNLFTTEGAEGVRARIQKLLLNGTFVYKYGSYGVGDDNFDVPQGICVSGTIAGTTYTPYRAPILRAKADGTACESYVSFQLRDEIQFREDSVANANYVAIQAPASVTSYKLILPAAAAGAKKNLQVGATNILAWTQNVDTDGSPTFAKLNLSATSNQIVLQSTGVTGTITATPASSNKVWTLQNVTGTIYQTGGTDVAVADGGTGVSTFALNGILFGNAANPIGVTAIGAEGQFLRVGANPYVPAWSTLTLPNTGTAYRLPVFSATNVMTELAAVGATGQYLAGNTGAIPSWANISAFEPALGNPGTTGWVLSSTDGGVRSWIAPGGGAAAFLDLTDVDEADYVGHAAEFIVVNGDEDGLEFSASSVAGHTLGGVNHTDVNAAAPNDDDILRFDTASGKWINEALPAAGNHDLLSATHGDTLADSVLRGDVMIGNSTPKWSRLGKGTATQILGGDGTDSKWVTACPTAAKYIVGLAHSDLSAEKVKAQLYNNYDLDDTPGSPNALDDEFDDSSLDGKWTITNPPATRTFDETTYSGFLSAVIPETAVADVFGNYPRIHETPPATGNFAMEFIAKVCLDVTFGATETEIGEWADIQLYLAESTHSKFVSADLGTSDAAPASTILRQYAIGIHDNGSGAIALMTNSLSVTGLAARWVYLKLKKETTAAYTSANTYSAWVSLNGLAWQWIGSCSHTFDHDCDEVGIMCRPPKAQAGAPSSGPFVDFFRRTV